jgi:hypothetical protein
VRTGPVDAHRPAVAVVAGHSREGGSVRRAVSGLLAWFVVFGLGVGGWQTLAPRSFYEDFPGFGRTWVSVAAPTTSTCCGTSVRATSPSGSWPSSRC